MSKLGSTMSEISDILKKPIDCNEIDKIEELVCRLALDACDDNDLRAAIQDRYDLLTFPGKEGF